MRRLKSQIGFTLLELILTIVIMGIVATVLGRILLNGYQNFTTAQNISETDWHGLLVLETMTNDIHDVRSAGSILTISPSTFSIIDKTGTTITYSVSGSTLLRNGITIAPGVSSFGLSYFDKNGAVTASASLVRYVSISLVLAQGGLSQSYTLLVGTRGMS